MPWRYVKTANDDGKGTGGRRDERVATNNKKNNIGSIEIVIPSDGTLYVGVGSNANVAHGGYNTACFDGDYIKIKKAR